MVRRTTVILGLELTFLPRATPLGFRSIKKAQKVVARFNAALKPLNTVDNTCHFVAKTEGIYLGRDIVEVTNGARPVEPYMLDTPIFRRRLREVFRIAHQLGLTARAHRMRDGVKRIFHTGGSHIHASINVFDQSHAPNFLACLDRFQTALFTDYANRPYIRWLFAHPFDDENSSLPITLKDLPVQGSSIGDPVQIMYAQSVAMGYTQAGIVARFTGRRKGCLPTFEHRYFDATANADETIANLRFLLNWTTYLSLLVEQSHKVPLTLTRDHFVSLKNKGYAWRTITRFLRALDLDPANYRALFERNYLTRMKWGEMV